MRLVTWHKRLVLAVLSTGLITAIATPPAHAAKWLEVDLADLAALPTEALDVLEDPHHAIQLAETELRGAEAAVDDAKDEIKASKQNIRGRKADLDAAKAVDKAARINAAGASAATGVFVTESSRELAKAKARLRWAKKEKSAADARVDREEASLQRVRAALELARAQLLVDQGSPAAATYDLAAFQAQADKATATLAKAAKKADKRARSADAAREDWEPGEGN